jgi:prepilin-type N-terminal cleavage/methylation domain-containing protein
MIRRIHGRDSRLGFTMMELMLVLAIIVTVSAMSWPMLERPLATHRLRSAADDVRAEWCQARVEAMRSGQTYAFRCATDGDRYSIAPEDSPEGSSLSSGESNAAMFNSSDEDLAACAEKTLPPGVRFVTTEMIEEDPADDLEPDSALAEGGTTIPILFYPDGTTSDARVRLGNDRGSGLDLMIRGLTGTVLVGDVVVIEERSQ